MSEDEENLCTSEGKYWHLIGRKVKKCFGKHGYFEGCVKNFQPPYFNITYEDGDEEEMTITELYEVLIPIGACNEEKMHKRTATETRKRKTLKTNNLPNKVNKQVLSTYLLRIHAPHSAITQRYIIMYNTNNII